MSLVQSSIISQFDRKTIESAKGVLILCVILGHIRLLTANYPQVFTIVNNFHVACFLLLPFLYDIRILSKESLDVWGGRYLFPFAVFMVGYSLVQFVVFGEGMSVIHYLVTLGKGLFIGTAEVIDAATGMQSLWFLSTLFAVVLVLGVVKRLNIPMLFVIPLAFVAHGLVGYLSEDVRLSIPFGLVSVGYIIVIGLFLRMIFVQFGVEMFKKYSLVFAVIWLVLQCVSTFYTQTRIGFSMMRFQSFQDVGALLLHDGLILCAMMFLVTTTALRSSRILCYLGENSLQIYLFHHFIYGVLYTVLVQLDVVSGLDDPNALLYGVILYPVVLLASVGAVELVKKSGVQPFLFPRSLSALKRRFV